MRNSIDPFQEFADLFASVEACNGRCNKCSPTDDPFGILKMLEEKSKQDESPVHGMIKELFQCFDELFECGEEGERFEDEDKCTTGPATHTGLSKYHRRIVPCFVENQDDVEFYVDIYDVLTAFPTGSSAVDHAVKKLLAPGLRGHKDRLQDLKEARDSIERAIQQEEILLSL